MKFEQIESLAQGILKDAGITSCPVPVEIIASKHRIKISRGPSADFSGILIRKNNFSLIGVSDTEAAVRQRFTIAHELGHFFLHENKDTFVDYRDNKKIPQDSLKEREANMFAAALLMPRLFVDADRKAISANNFLTEDDVEKLAMKYDVSQEAMSIRLMNLRST